MIEKTRDVYKINEALENKFYQVPQELFTNSKYREKLSIYSKMAYSLLLDRLSLSRKNNWYNENGEIYLIYTREQIMQELNISKPTATKVFNELKETKLVFEERQGRGFPNIIYIGKIIHEEVEIKKSNKLTSKSKNSFIKEVKRFCPINTNIIKTNKNVYPQNRKLPFKDYEQRVYDNLEMYYDNA